MAMQSEIKKNMQETNSERKETGTKVNNLEQKEEINIQSERNEETINEKSEKRFRNLRDNLKHSNIWIIGVPEGEEEEQEIEKLSEKIMKESFPNLAKEIENINKSQEEMKLSLIHISEPTRLSW